MDSIRTHFALIAVMRLGDAVPLVGGGDKGLSKKNDSAILFRRDRKRTVGLGSPAYDK
jgi:hypothetical protein